MLVENWMSKTIVTADADYSMHKAIKLLKENNIRMLPVLNDKKLIGIVTDRDLKRASASDATALEIHELFYLLDTIKIKEVMTHNPITIPFNYTLGETSDILLKHKISGAPVLNGKGELAGIITQSDIFRGIIALTGINKKGIQMAFRLKDKAGSIREVTNIIREYGGRMVSILTAYEGVEDGYRNVYIRFYGIEKPEVIGLVDMFCSRKMLLYVVDHNENYREVFQKSFN